jgi:flavin reductase (DIM6/NTAB) family NADH-FMN oxidoreductase RutF
MTDADVARAFSALVGDLEAPMSIVTVQAGRDRAGCLVGFSTQTSINPPRFLVCLSRRNHTYNVVMPTGRAYSRCTSSARKITNSPSCSAV